MFSKVLVATDLSPASECVLHCMKGLIPLGQKQAVLVHAIGIQRLETMVHGMAHFLEPYLAKQKAYLEDQGFETEMILATGPAVIEVNRIAQEHQASLIVVGTHGATLAREMLIGGTAMGIVHQATVPVLVIRLKIMAENQEVRCVAGCQDLRRHILFCTDFSETAERAFQYVAQLVEGGVRFVTLLHVQDKTRIGTHLEHRLEEFNQTDQRRLECLKARLKEIAEVDVRIQIPYGHPVAEVLRVANEEEDDTLVVMGSQGRGFLRRGSSSEVSAIRSFAVRPSLFCSCPRCARR